MKKYLYILPALGLVFGLGLFFIAARVDGRVPDGLCGALMQNQESAQSQVCRRARCIYHATVRFRAR